MRACSKCGEPKPFDADHFESYRRRPGGPKQVTQPCRECGSARRRARQRTKKYKLVVRKRRDAGLTAANNRRWGQKHAHQIKMKRVATVKTPAQTRPILAPFLWDVTLEEVESLWNHFAKFEAPARADRFMEAS